MQNHQSVQTLPALDRKHELEQLINNSLRRDWVIRIEYGLEDAGRLRWQLWGKQFFAVENSEPVLNAINTCRVSYPAHAIRLFAEKLSPATQLGYMIQEPSTQSTQEETAPQQEVLSRLLERPLAQLRSGGSRLWRYITVFAMLLGSILLIEGATN